MASTYTPGEPEVNSESLPEQAVAAPLLETGDISILDLAVVLVTHRRTILRVTVVATVLGVIVSLLLPKIYTAKTLILTPGNAPSASAAVMGQLGLLSNAMNASNNLGLNDPNAVYVTMLNSDSVARGVIDRFGLRREYDSATWVDTVKAFQSNLRVSSGNDGTITIEFDDKDPNRAAAVANGVVEEFRKVTQQNAVTDASQRRVYFAVQLEKAKKELTDAEVALKKGQEATGMLDLDKQTLAIVTAMATLKGQIAAQQVQVQAMRSFATSRNPDVIRAETELAAMRDQLAQFEHSNVGGNGDIFIATKNIPASGLEYLRRYRDVKYYEELYELLGKQYEAAVVDEGTNGAIVQVVDQATPPDKKSRPKRALIVLAFLLVGFMGTYVWAVATEITARLARDPIQGPKLSAIRDGLRPSGRLWTRIRRRTRAPDDYKEL